MTESRRCAKCQALLGPVELTCPLCGADARPEVPPAPAPAAAPPPPTAPAVGAAPRWLPTPTLPSAPVESKPEPEDPQQERKRMVLAALFLGLAAALLLSTFAIYSTTTAAARHLEEGIVGKWGWSDRDAPVTGANVKFLIVRGPQLCLYNGVVLEPGTQEAGPAAGSGTVLGQDGTAPRPAGPVLAGFGYEGKYALDGDRVVIEWTGVLPGESGWYPEAYSKTVRWFELAEWGKSPLETVFGSSEPVPEREERRLPDGSVVVLRRVADPKWVPREATAEYRVRLSRDSESLTLVAPRPRPRQRTRDDAIQPGVAPMEETGDLAGLLLTFLTEVKFTRDWQGWDCSLDIRNGKIFGVRFRTEPASGLPADAPDTPEEPPGLDQPGEEGD